MAFFDSFTDSIKQKWLQFFQANREWITLQMTVESVYTPDGGKRPSSYLILGVINALEPKLAQLMFPFAKLNPDADALIEVLDLHFDPDIALGNRLSPTVEPEMYFRQPAVVMADISEPETQSFPVSGIGLNDLGNETQATWAIDRDDDGFGHISLSDEDIAQDSEGLSSLEAVNNFGHASFAPISLTNESDDQKFNLLASVDENAFGEIPDNAFGEIDENAFTGLNLSEENSFDELSTSESEENGFDDVVSDIWGDETSLLNGDDNLEELPSEVFNESEMARLFPNN
ncbi:DUF5331 domain-containing protein [Dolichospermum sp. ST_con]|nr:DUF5331 domain-containing protein [Dolichospermum sp. ST_con]MDD1421475.1 DUF5331 domain-containing protein [Dolichospermum sp. ST_sed1]MDD1425940.1 DUF5331 domain-containing protein [Dolichospermum sp. ST_sed9]MDD1433474.1 DUF5331 domain-containing protein [Dolichospermum sp. ST_sed6]MDD1437655.1 DUF5331 domain-containing protein [Dolichospermum sp. ST_sed10]MDD1442870.1 DUF5331 domain-containing protein [Dolichospermum sp. ST_sed3]MDD1449487.1 DUF5331 domain-containing protein [Dolichosp